MKKLLPTLAMAAAIGTGGYWYFSPYVALHSMKAAAEAKDADRLNTYVDYPKLRESFKNDLNARLTESLPSGDNELAKAGAALGMMLSRPLVDAMVDTMIQPEFIIRALNEAKAKKGVTEGNADPQGSSAPAEKKDVEWSSERKSADLIVAYGAERGKPEARVGFVLERSGFADWKLTAIRMPN